MSDLQRECETAIAELTNQYMDRIDALEAKVSELVVALRRLCEYVEDNRRHIPLRMGSKNTGALIAAQDLLVKLGAWT